MTAVDLATFRANRRHYIGGTDVAAICGLSPWASPLSVFLDKTGQPREQSETLAMRRGLALEDFIAAEFCREHTGRFVTYRPKPIIRTDWGFPAGASIDRMVALKEHPRTPIALLEAKTAFRNGWSQFNEKAEDLPDQYFVQVQWYLAVAGLQVLGLRLEDAQGTTQSSRDVRKPLSAEQEQDDEDEHEQLGASQIERHHSTFRRVRPW